jgi:glycosyltransferase involved in cell wall biosynthesis
MKKIKVGYDCRDLFFAQTGTRTFSEELIREIKRDVSVELVELAPSKVKPPIGVFAKALSHILFIYWKMIDLPLKSRKANIDYLICPDYVAPFLFLGKIKTLPVFHGCNIWELPKNYNTLWRIYFSFLARLGERRAFRVLTVSEFSKSRLIQVLGIDPEKITVIPIGSKSAILVDDAPAIVNGPTEYEYLLHIGILDKRKNLPALVEAFDLLEDRHLHLVLVGGRPSKLLMDGYPELISTIQQLGLTDRVHLEGYVADEDLPAYYRHAKAYIFPSIYEGFGIPILEAYHYGLPLAASATASLPEVVGKGGLLFDPHKVLDIAHVIGQLLHLSDNDLISMRKAQNEVLSRFNWPNAWKRIKELMDG